MFSFANNYDEVSDYGSYCVSEPQVYVKYYKKYKFTGYVKETNKAILLRFGEISKWIPKSVIRSINYKSLTAEIHSGIFNKCSSIIARNVYKPEFVKSELPYLHPYYSVVCGVVEKFLWEGDEHDYENLSENNVFLTKSMANLSKEC